MRVTLSHLCVLPALGLPPPPFLSVALSGASILSSHSSETYGTRTAVISLFGIPLWYHFQTQRAIIQVGLKKGSPAWLSACHLPPPLWGLGPQSTGAPGSASGPCAATFHMICLPPTAKCLPRQLLGIPGPPGLCWGSLVCPHPPHCRHFGARAQSPVPSQQHHQRPQGLRHLGEYLSLAALLSRSMESPFLTAAAFRGEKWKDVPIVQR